MRTVFSLDASWVSSVAGEQCSGRRAAALRRWTLPLLPVLALAPAAFQRRWRSAWGFPSELATGVSALLELAIGGFGVVQAFVAALQGGWFLPDPLRPLVVFGPLMSLEGLLRLHASMALSEPMGSAVGLPLMLFERARNGPLPRPIPQPTAVDDERGVLELMSKVQRPDWVPEGVLHYRDRRYRLRSVVRVGSGWCYQFERVEDGADGPRLRLVPAVSQVQPEEPVRSPRLLTIAMITALACLAPRQYQERWARSVGTRPIWFTVLGAGAELLGGWFNLRQAAGDERGMLAVNLFFVAEAVVRFALLVITGRPVGSLLGIPVRPLLDRLMPEEE
jgi:hypothetical protein